MCGQPLRHRGHRHTKYMASSSKLQAGRWHGHAISPSCHRLCCILQCCSHRVNDHLNFVFCWSPKRFANTKLSTLLETSRHTHCFSISSKVLAQVARASSSGVMLTWPQMMQLVHCGPCPSCTPAALSLWRRHLILSSIHAE